MCPRRGKGALLIVKRLARDESFVIPAALGFWPLGGGEEFKLESLILAQIERWRRA